MPGEAGSRTARVLGAIGAARLEDVVQVTLLAALVVVAGAAFGAPAPVLVPFGMVVYGCIGNVAGAICFGGDDPAAPSMLVRFLLLLGAIVLSSLVIVVGFAPGRALDAVPVVIGFSAGVCLRFWANQAETAGAGTVG